MKILKKIIKPILTHPRVAKKLCRFFLVADNKLDRYLNELVLYSEQGVHPKHRLMDYHQFFMDNIKETDTVLDVGCGQGIVANDIADKAKKVTGVDFEKKKIDWATQHYKKPNLNFVLGDATKVIPKGEYTIIVLSNVLEHIEERVPFLKVLIALAPKILIRVPMINRDWVVLYKKELGMDYRMDDTHFIEFTQAEIKNEIEQAGLRIESLQVNFGEFWIVARV